MITVKLALVSHSLLYNENEGTQHMNSIFTIKPYKDNGIWMFDDESVGLKREPFVAGVPEIINRLVEDIPDAESGFIAFFSEIAFPDSIELTRVYIANDIYESGAWYHWQEADLFGWLCPALFKYYEQAPKKLYVQVQGIEHD